jgi:four helix bundle protein
MAITSYRDLEVWQVAMEFVVRVVYGLTNRFSREELYGLTSQLRRAAVSIPSNVSEGHRQGSKVYLRFVTIALGSLAEAETQIELARRLKFAADDDVAPVAESADSVAGLLHGLRRAPQVLLNCEPPNPQSPIPNPQSPIPNPYS